MGFAFDIIALNATRLLFIRHDDNSNMVHICMYIERIAIMFVLSITEMETRMHLARSHRYKHISHATTDGRAITPGQKPRKLAQHTNLQLVLQFEFGVAVQQQRGVLGGGAVLVQLLKGWWSAGVRRRVWCLGENNECVGYLPTD